MQVWEAESGGVVRRERSEAGSEAKVPASLIPVALIILQQHHADHIILCPHVSPKDQAHGHLVVAAQQVGHEQ